MTSLVNEIRSATPESCWADRCDDSEVDGCCVDMTDAPEPFVLIDMDCTQLPIKGSETKCDFIFASDQGNWVVPIELKKGSANVGRAARQLQAGARFAERITPKDAKVKFLAVIAFGGRLHRADNMRLRRFRIRFRERQAPIELMECGKPLTDALRRRADG